MDFDDCMQKRRYETLKSIDFFVPLIPNPTQISCLQRQAKRRVVTIFFRLIFMGTRIQSKLKTHIFWLFKKNVMYRYLQMRKTLKVGISSKDHGTNIHHIVPLPPKRDRAFLLCVSSSQRNSENHEGCWTIGLHWKQGWDGVGCNSHL